MPAQQLVSEIAEGIRVLRFRAPRMLDMETTTATGAELQEQFTGTVCPDTVIDLSNLQVICSAGIGMLIHAARSAREHGGRLVLCGMQPALTRMFHAVRLDRMFEIYNDVPTARAALTPPTSAPN